MSPIRSASIAVLASAVLATTLTGCGIGGEPQDTSPIVIAADLELSGASAPIGISDRNRAGAIHLSIVGLLRSCPTRSALARGSRADE